MDLHPDAEVAAGMLRAGGIRGAYLNWLNDRGYRHADFIVDLGPYMRQRILAKGVGSRTASTVPVWGAAPRIAPRLPRPRLPRVQALRAAGGWQRVW